jgi:N6-adenosine-specific RNA methylase IME4
MSTELTYFNAAKTALAKATKIDEVKEIRDKAEAVRLYKKMAGESQEMQNQCAEIAIRADRRIGEILRDMPKSEGGRPTKTGTKKVPVSGAVTLADMGLDKKQSEYAQAVAAMTESEFERQIEEIEKSPKALTRAGFRTTVQRKKKAKEHDRHRAENAKKVATVPDPTTLESVFSTIVVDPPWDWGDEGDGNQFGRAKHQYKSWSIEQIEALPVLKLADKDCHLYLWITNRSMPKGFRLLDAWGFRFVTILTWPKPSFGMGNYFRGQTEHVLFGVRGSLELKRKNASTLLPTWKRGPGGHSSKPPEFLEFAESCSPGPYLEMFSRSKRKGWSSWGEDGLQQ